MIRSYWLRILLCGLGGLLAGFIIAQLTPKQYDAIVQIMVDQKQYMPSGGRTNADEAVSDLVEAGRARSVETQVELMTSFGVLTTAAERVAERFNLSASDQDSEINPQNLEDRVSITATTQSDIVTLRVRLSRPEIAEAVADEIYRAFDEQNTKVSRTGADRAIRTLESQLSSIDSQLKSIDEQTASLKARFEVPDITQEQNQAIASMRDLQTTRDAGRMALAGAAARVQTLQNELDRTPRTMQAGVVTVRNPLITNLRADIAAARTQRSELLQRYQPDHEAIQAIDRRLRTLDEQLQEQEASIKAETTNAPNPNYNSLKNDLAQARAALSENQKRYQEAEVAFQAQKDYLTKLPEMEKQLAQLLRKQIVLEKNYTTYMDRLESLKAAQTGRMSVSSLVTKATGINKPTVPNTGLNLTLGLALGIALGVLWSVGTESRRSPIRTIGQLNRLALQPVYRLIPELRRPFRGLDAAPAEAYESLLINFVRSGKKGYRLGVVGVTPGAGATTTSMNLAVSAARGGYSVLLIEGDNSSPIRRRFGKAGPDAGLGPWQASPNITVLPISSQQQGQSFSLSQSMLEAERDRDLTIFDFLPSKVSSDANLFASELDEVVLLVQPGITRTVDFLQAQQSLTEAGCKVLTIAFSRTRETSEDIPMLEQDAELKAIGSA